MSFMFNFAIHWNLAHNNTYLSMKPVQWNQLKSAHFGKGRIFLPLHSMYKFFVRTVILAAFSTRENNVCTKNLYVERWWNWALVWLAEMDAAHWKQVTYSKSKKFVQSGHGRKFHIKFCTFSKRVFSARQLRT